MQTSGGKPPLGLWGLIAGNLILTIIFAPGAISNFTSGPDAIPAGFHLLYGLLSLATPLLLSAAISSLGIALIRKRPSALRAAWWLQRASFWILTFRAVALILVSFSIPNESAQGTLLFIMGATLLIPALVTLAGSNYLKHLKDATSPVRE